MNQQTIFTVGLDRSHVGRAPLTRDYVVNAACRILGAHGYDAFTIIDVRGYWQGEPEDSIRIELTHEADTCDADAIARALAHECTQQCVLVVESDVRARLVERYLPFE